MTLLNGPFDVIILVLIFLVGLKVILSFRKITNTKIIRSAILYSWHTLFCIFYASFVITNGGDAINYYDGTYYKTFGFGPGTGIIAWFSTFLGRTLDISFLGVSLIFNIVGALGLLFFDGALRTIKINKNKIHFYFKNIIVFFPLFSFWSSGIGKDPICFLAVTLALWGSLDFYKRKWFIVIAIIILFLVRPHIGLIMLAALLFSLTFNNSKKYLVKKIVLISLLTSSLYIALPIVSKFVGIQDWSNSNEIAELIDKRQQLNQEGTGGTDISNMSPPLRIFSYLFRPLPHEYIGVAQLMSGLENLILLLIMFTLIYCILFKKLQKQNNININQLFLLSYFVVALGVLAFTTANLGISSRQKIMILPMIIFLILNKVGDVQVKK